MTAENARLRAELDKAHRLLSQMVGWQRDAEIAKARLEAERDELLIAAKEFDADLSEWCDGPPRDRLRAAIAKVEGGK